jgi:hypothetical protein
MQWMCRVACAQCRKGARWTYLCASAPIRHTDDNDAARVPLAERCSSQQLRRQIGAMQRVLYGCRRLSIEMTKAMLVCKTAARFADGVKPRSLRTGFLGEEGAFSETGLDAWHGQCTAPNTVQPFLLRRLASPSSAHAAPRAFASDTCVMPVGAPQNSALRPEEELATEDARPLVFELARRRGRGRRFVELNLEHAFPNGAPWETSSTVFSRSSWTTIITGICIALVVALCAGYSLTHGDRLFRSIMDRASQSSGPLRGDVPSSPLGSGAE